MIIENSTLNYIEEIFALYRIATEYMKERSAVHWPEFDRTMVETEIAENRQWKMIPPDGITACVWATTFSDQQIWEERNADPAVYIHRIATNPACRGQNLVALLTKWAKAYAHSQGKRFVRMDTVGNNAGLIKHYTQCGFTFIGLLTLKNTEGLPAHYHNATVSLFETLAGQE